MRATLLGEIVALDTLEAVYELETSWRQLEQQADASFFISWSWIGPWLEIALKNATELYLFRCKLGNCLISLGVVSRSTIWRNKIFRSRVLALNDTPQSTLNMTIEYNDLLTLRGHETDAWSCFKQSLLQAPCNWDELIISGITANSWDLLKQEGSHLAPINDEMFYSWGTDISSIEGNIEKLLAPLSRNRRWQIRRSIKAFAEDGSLVVSCAENAREALVFFDSMEELHTRRWNRVGQAGSFANPNWVNFHRAIITNSFDRGEIQILKISAGDHAIGYVYSFVWRGIVYMLQTGFAQDNDNTRRPGYVSHCLAMSFNSTRGIAHYDFMHGDAEYKRVLGQAQSLLVWGRLQRPRLSLWLENQAKSTYRAMRKIFSRLAIRR